MDRVQDPRRLEALFARHSAQVRAYARRIDPVTADDLTSEVCVIAARRLAGIQEEPRPWLLACARRVLAIIIEAHADGSRC